jgi:hypothetical protein
MDERKIENSWRAKITGKTKKSKDKRKTQYATKGGMREGKKGRTENE